MKLRRMFLRLNNMPKGVFVKSAEHRKKISETLKKLYANPEDHPFFGRHHSEESKRKMSNSRKGMPSYWRGKKRPELSGVNNWNWKGGITKINFAIRNSLEYKKWRMAVFERDDFRCVLCHRSGIYLNADHIKPFSMYPELRFVVRNGRTLCKDCHKKTDTYLVKAHKIMGIDPTAPYRYKKGNIPRNKGLVRGL